MIRCWTFILLFSLNSCASYQHHHWAVGRTFDNEEVEFIQADKLTRVKYDMLGNAITKLKEREFVLLSDEEFALYAKDQKIILNEERAYLVRGVAWSNPPLFSIVAYEKEKNILHIQQYTYNGEIYIPGSKESHPSPVIVIIKGDLNKVYPNAIIGGDRILSWPDSEKAWKEKL